jgi:DNA-binding NtrC family response regulator
LGLYSILRLLAKILVVDDEEVVVGVICAALKSGEHEITVARSGNEAVAAAQEAVSLDLLIIDDYLKPDRASDIAKRILPQHPAMRVLHISGYFRDQLEARDSLPTKTGFIRKPFTARQIRDAATDMLGDDEPIF